MAGSSQHTRATALQLQADADRRTIAGLRASLKAAEAALADALRGAAAEAVGGNGHAG